MDGTCTTASPAFLSPSMPSTPLSPSPLHPPPPSQLSFRSTLPKIYDTLLNKPS